MVKYNNSPIVEAVCEFRFTEDTNWDLTVPGLIFEDIRAQYPQKEQRATQEFSIHLPGGAPGIARSQIKRADLAVFSTDDRKSIIQIGPRILSTSRIKPYCSWDDFKSQINYAFEKIRGRVELNGIQRIGLRYVNRIMIPIEQDGVDLEKYFDFRPHCGPKLPQSHGEFRVDCIFPYNGERDLCKIGLSDAMPENKDSLAFLLSIDYFLAKPRSLPIAQLMEWVEEAHMIVETLFEGCVLPPLRDIFEEVKE